MTITQELLVKVKLDSDGAVRSIKAVEDGLGGVAEGGKDASDSVKTFGMKAQNAAVLATGLNQALELAAKAFGTVRDLATATTRSFVDYEKAAIGVQKTTNITDAELDILSRRFQFLSETSLPASTEELFRFGEVAGQLGVTAASDLENIAVVATQLQTATNLAGDVAVESLAKIIGISAEAIDTIDELGGVVVQLGNTFKTNEAQIVRVASELGRSTAQFNRTSTDVVALSAALAELDVQAQLGGSVVGKAFRTIDTVIRKGTSDQIAALEKLTGVVRDDLVKVFEENAVDAFDLFVQGLGRVNDAGGSVSDVLEVFSLKGDEVNKVLPVLATRADLVEKALKSSRIEFARSAGDLEKFAELQGKTVDELQITSKELRAQGALIAEARKAFNTLGARLSVLRNAFGNLATDIGRLFAPALKSVVDTLITTVRQIRILANSLQVIDFGALLQQFKTLIAAIGIVLIPLLKKLVIAFAPVIATAALTATKFVLIGAAILGLASTIDIVVRNFSSLSGVFDLVAAGFNKSLALFLKGFRAFAKRFFAIIQSLVEPLEMLPAGIGKGFQGVVPALKKGLKSIDKVIDDQNDRATKNILDFANKTDSIDLGFAGEAFKQGKNLLNEFNIQSEKLTAEIEKQTKAQAAANKEATESLDIAESLTDEQKKIADQQLKALDELKAKNMDLAFEIQKIGLDSEQLRAIELAQENQKLDVLRDQLAAKGVLNKAIENEIDLQRELLRTRSERESTQESFDGLSGFSQTIAVAFPEAQFAQAVGQLAGFEAGLASVAGPIAAAFDPKNIEKLADTLNQIADFPNQLLSAVSQVSEALSNIIREFPKALANLADQLPAILQEIVAKIPMAIEAILTGLVDNLPAIIDGLVAAFVQLLTEGVPRVFEVIADKLPDVIRALVRAVPQIAGALVESFISLLTDGGLERIVGALLRLIPAVIEGILLGLREGIVKAFGGVAELSIDTDQVAEEFKALQENINRSSSELFEVIDLEASTRALDTADRIRTAIDGGTTRLGNIFQKFINALLNAWRTIFDTIIQPIVDIVIKAWRWVFDNILDPLANIVRKAWLWVYDNILIPLAGFVQRAWQWVVDNILDPMASVVQKAFLWVKQNIIDPLSDILTKAFQPLENFLRMIGGRLADAFRPLGDFLARIGGVVSNAFKGLGGAISNAFKSAGLGKIFDDIFGGIGSLWAKIFPPSTGKGDVERALNIDVPGIRFAEGGIVPGNPTVQGDSLLNDKVLALLSPGEIVLSRSQVAKLREDAASQNVELGLFNLGRALSDTAASLDPTTNVSVKVPSFDDFKKAGGNLFEDLSRAAASLDPSKLFDTDVNRLIRDKVFEGLRNLIGLNQGGLVPGIGSRDTVPAMLTPGEFVMNRNAVADIGLSNLRNMNSGRMGMGTTVNNVSINVQMKIENKGDLDSNFVKNRLMPEIKKEFKNSTQRGELLVSNRGLF